MRRRKQALWIQQGGRCCWCNCAMLHWNDLHSDPSKREKHGIRVNRNGEMKLRSMPQKLATLEHLRDRYHPERQVAPVGREQRWALACWQCNSERGNQRTKERPIEELWRRSRSAPLAQTTDFDG